MKITVEKTVVKLGVDHVVSRTLVVAPFGLTSGISESIITQKGGLIVGTAPSSLTELPPGGVGTYLTPDPTTLRGLKYTTPTLDVLDPVNYLVNGGFDVGQRIGTALFTVADNKYGPDRWRVTRETADVQCLRIAGQGVSGLTCATYAQFFKTVGLGKILVAQIVENVNTVPMCGRTVIFQAKLWSNAARTVRMAILELQSGGTADTIPASLVSVWGAGGTDPTFGTNLAVISGAVSCALTTTPQTFSVSVTIPTTSKNVLCVVWSNAGLSVSDSLYMAEASLRFGAAQMSWTPRPAAMELALCLRYYEKSFNTNTVPAQSAGTGGCFAMPGLGASTYTRGTLRFGVPKRSTPTMTTYNPSANNGQARDVTANADCSLTSTTGNVGGVEVIAQGAVGTAMGNDILVHWTAESEL